jgi:hypothetical protein
MLYSEIIAVCSEIRAKHINTQCRQNVLLCVKAGGTHSRHWILKTDYFPPIISITFTKKTGNVRITLTQRCVRVTIFAVEKQSVLEIRNA